MQEHRLWCASNKVWTGAMFLENCITNFDNPTQIELTKINLLKTFHEVSVPTMIGLAKTFWSDP
jgi:hypothetical protein